jgi:hypothetical protein
MNPLEMKKGILKRLIELMQDEEVKGFKKKKEGQSPKSMVIEQISVEPKEKFEEEPFCMLEDLSEKEEDEDEDEDEDEEG